MTNPVGLVELNKKQALIVITVNYVIALTCLKLDNEASVIHSSNNNSNNTRIYCAHLTKNVPACDLKSPKWQRYQDLCSQVIIATVRL